MLNLNGDRGDLGDLKLGADFGPGSIMLFSSSLSEVGEIASGCGVGFRPIVNGSIEILMCRILTAPQPNSGAASPAGAFRAERRLSSKD